MFDNCGWRSKWRGFTMRRHDVCIIQQAEAAGYYQIQPTGLEFWPPEKSHQLKRLVHPDMQWPKSLGGNELFKGTLGEILPLLKIFSLLEFLLFFLGLRNFCKLIIIIFKSAAEIILTFILGALCPLNPPQSHIVSESESLSLALQIVIPFFSLLIKDIYFLNEGCANRLPNGHVNFEVGWMSGSSPGDELQQVLQIFPPPNSWLFTSNKTLLLIISTSLKGC